MFIAANRHYASYTRPLVIPPKSHKYLIFVKRDSEKDSEDVFDTFDLIMDMDDLKNELSVLLVEQYGQVPLQMEQIVHPMYVMRRQWLAENCF